MDKGWSRCKFSDQRKGGINHDKRSPAQKIQRATEVIRELVGFFALRFAALRNGLENGVADETLIGSICDTGAPYVICVSGMIAHMQPEIQIHWSHCKNHVCSTEESGFLNLVIDCNCLVNAWVRSGRSSCHAHHAQGVYNSGSGGWRTAVTRGDIGTGKAGDTHSIEHDCGSRFCSASNRRNGLKHAKIYFRSICDVSSR